MAFETIELEKKDQIATIWFNRPDKLNAASPQVFTDLDDAITDVEADDDIRVVILTGRGDAFRPTSIRETAFPGVWSVPHMNLHGAELSALVEIARLPSALITPERDLEDFAAALEHRLTA
mgnify:CR=1 FL=1